jgi:hypothetical protein
VTGGAIAFPGAVPTIWCCLQGLPKERQRGLIQPFILIMQVATIAYFSGVGIMTSETLMVSLVTASARPRHSADPACPRRRGDRIAANVWFWYSQTFRADGGHDP